MNAGEQLINNRTKWVISVLVFVLCVMLGSGLMFGILYLTGIPVNDDTGILELLNQPQNTWKIRLAFASSHIVGFIVSSLIIGKVLGLLDLQVLIKSIQSFSIQRLTGWLLLLVACYPLAGLLGYLAGTLPLPEWMSDAENSSYEALEGLMTMENSLQLLANLVVIAVLPGLGEEMFFRGIFQGELQRRMGAGWKIIVISAFVFAAFHLQFAGFFPKFIIGLVLSASFYYTRNLLYPIVIHVLNNGFHVGLAYLHPERLQESIELPSPDAIQISLVILTLPAIYFLFQHLTKDHLDGGSIKNEA